MGWTAILVLLALQQDPTLAAARYVVELDTGARLEGELIRRTDDYVELRLGPSTVVGLERSKVVAMHAVDDSPPPAAAPPLRPRDQLFVLHDEHGRAVGRLHATVAPDSDGRLRLAEEWKFGGAGHSTEVTRLEVVTAALQPVSCFYHERVVQEAGGRVEHERLVRGTVEDGHLIVDVRSDKAHSRQSYPWRPDMTFPLCALETRRQGRDAPHEQVVYEPERMELLRCRFDVDPHRRVDWRGSRRIVRELRCATGRRANLDWVDAAGTELRREVNGPDLVAVAADAGTVERYTNSRDPVFASAVQAEPGGRFALWAPDPSWQFVDSAAGSVTLRAPLYDASACLMAFDQIGSEVELRSAADTVSLWLAQVEHGFELIDHRRTRVRDRDAVQLIGRFARGTVEYHCEADVLRAPDGTVMVLCLVVPRRELEGLRAQLDRIAAMAELRPLPGPGQR